MKHLLPLVLLLLLCACAKAPLPEPTAAPSAEPTAQPTAEPTAEPTVAPTLSPEKPALIAHAGGAIYGYKLTNSLEALDSAYARGFRCIEVDLSLTSDGAVALIHDWESMAKRLLFSEGQRSLADFLAAETLEGLTLMDLDALLDWLDTHPDCRIVTDVKAEDNLAVLARVWEAAGARRGNFVPQIYSYAEYEDVAALGYADIILTVYRMGPLEPEAFRAFWAAHPLWALTMPYARLNEDVSALAAEGLTVYAHTVNDLSDFELWRDKGLYGLYTDYFEPSHWQVPS